VHTLAFGNSHAPANMYAKDSLGFLICKQKMFGLTSW